MFSLRLRSGLIFYLLSQGLALLSFVSHLLGFCGLFEYLLFFVREAVQAVVVNLLQDSVDFQVKVTLLDLFSFPDTILDFNL